MMAVENIVKMLVGFASLVESCTSEEVCYGTQSSECYAIYVRIVRDTFMIPFIIVSVNSKIAGKILYRY